MRKRQLRSGGVFIITIGVLAALVAILAAAAASQKVNIDAIGNRMNERRALLAAQSGVQRALAELATQDPNATNLQDPWATLGETGATTEFDIGADSFRIQVVDASSFINLNTASQTQLEKLPLTAEQIDCLLDWREASTQPRADGAKDEYYNQLSTPYNAKLRGLDTFDELLLVKKFTLATLFDAPTNQVTTNQTLPQKPNGDQPSLYDLTTVTSTSKYVSTAGQALRNITTLTNANQLVQLGIPQPTAGILFAGRAGMTTYRAMLTSAGNVQVGRILVNNFAPTGAASVTGKVNANTATEAVLDSIENLPPDIAAAIVTRQSTGFTQLGDLFDVPGYSIQVAQQTMDSFAVNSQTFLARIVGKGGNAHVSLEALITLGDNGPQLTHITRLPFPDMAIRWGWEEQTTSTTILKEAVSG